MTGKGVQLLCFWRCRLVRTANNIFIAKDNSFLGAVHGAFHLLCAADAPSLTCTHGLALFLPHIFSSDTSLLLSPHLCITTLSRTAMAAPKSGSLLESGKYSDLTVTCGDRSWRLHKSIVCLHSDFFASACDRPFKVSSLTHRHSSSSLLLTLSPQ